MYLALCSFIKSICFYNFLMKFSYNFELEERPIIIIVRKTSISFFPDFHIKVPELSYQSLQTFISKFPAGGELDAHIIRAVGVDIIAFAHFIIGILIVKQAS